MHPEELEKEFWEHIDGLDAQEFLDMLSESSTGCNRRDLMEVGCRQSDRDEWRDDFKRSLS